MIVILTLIIDAVIIVIVFGSVIATVIVMVKYQGYHCDCCYDYLFIMLINIIAVKTIILMTAALLIILP